MSVVMSTSLGRISPANLAESWRPDGEEWKAEDMAVAFAGMELDAARFELRRNGTPVPMEPQAFDVLVYLVQHRDRVVAKEELMDQIWGGRFVSETAVTSRIKQIRRALGDDGRVQKLIKTSHGRGYRFVAEVREVHVTGRARRRRRATLRSVAGALHTPRDGLGIAYQVTGSGDRDIVLVAGFISHLELDWGNPRHDHFLERLSSMGRLIRFDKRGTGMSDRPPGVPDLETRMHDVLAVMDAAGSQRATLFGYSEGGPMAVLFAATHPERVSELVLFGSYAKRTWSPDYPHAQRMEDRIAYTDQLISTWDWEADMWMRCPSADPAMTPGGRACRTAATPATVRALMDMNSMVDVRKALTAVRVPTLVVHRTGDQIDSVANGRYLADHIAGASWWNFPATIISSPAIPTNCSTRSRSSWPRRRRGPSRPSRCGGGRRGRPGRRSAVDGLRPAAGPQAVRATGTWCCSTGRRPRYAPPAAAGHPRQRVQSGDRRGAPRRADADRLRGRHGGRAGPDRAGRHAVDLGDRTRPARRIGTRTRTGRHPRGGAGRSVGAVLGGCGLAPPVCGHRALSLSAHRAAEPRQPSCPDACQLIVPCACRRVERRPSTGSGPGSARLRPSGCEP